MKAIIFTTVVLVSIISLTVIGLVQNYQADRVLRCPHFRSAPEYIRYDCEDGTYYVQG